MTIGNTPATKASPGIRAGGVVRAVGAFGAFGVDAFVYRGSRFLGIAGFVLAAVLTAIAVLARVLVEVTPTLERWCDRFGIGEPVEVLRQVPDAEGGGRHARTASPPPERPPD